jgi:hypothetical protein
VPPATGTNGLAIASLVLGIIGGVFLAVIFGFVALSQIRKRPQNGRGLAIAGLIISGLWVLIFCVTAGLMTAASNLASDQRDSIVDSNGNPALDPSARFPGNKLEAGDCLKSFDESEQISQFPAISCEAPHDGEVIGTFDLTGSSYPSAETIRARAEEECAALAQAYIDPAHPALDSLEVQYLYPVAVSWDKGERKVICVVTNPGKLMTSLKNP